MKKKWFCGVFTALMLLSGCSAGNSPNINPPPTNPPPTNPLPNIPSSGMYISPQFSQSQLQMLNSVTYSTRPNPTHEQYTSERTKKEDMAADTLQLNMTIAIPPNATATKPQPLAIFVHGGGFTGGGRLSVQQKVLPYALGGYVVANLDYRLTANNQSSAERRLWAIKTSLEDVQNAIRFLKKNATQYHIDTSRIVVMGGSAGGGLSLLNAVEYDAAGLVNDYPGLSSRVTAAMSTGATLENDDPANVPGLIHYDASDTPVLLFHAKETDSSTKATWTGSVLPTQQKINASGNECLVVAQPNMTHTIWMDLGGDYWEYIKPFLWDKLRLAELQ